MVLRQHERIREMVAAAQDEVAADRSRPREGVTYLAARDKNGGKSTHLTKEAAEAILSGQDTDRYIVEEWEKPPSTQAFADLMDRALDRAKDVVDANTSGKDRKSVV